MTHAFLLPREPSNGHKFQGLGYRWSIEDPSGFSFLDHNSCELQRLQVETGESRGLWASDSLGRTHRLSTGLFLKVRSENQSLLALRGLGVWLSPESEGVLLRWTRVPSPDPRLRPVSLPGGVQCEAHSGWGFSEPGFLLAGWLAGSLGGVPSQEMSASGLLPPWAPSPGRHDHPNMEGNLQESQLHSQRCRL